MATSRTDRGSIDVRTIGPRLSTTEAVARTKRMTLGRLFRTRVAGLFGREGSPEIYPAYYPDYVAYTSVTLHRYVGGDRDLKFLAGIDAITGRVARSTSSCPTVASKASIPPQCSNRPSRKARQRTLGASGSGSTSIASTDR